MPSFGSRASPLTTKRALCSTGSRKVDGQFAVLHLPVGHHGARNLVDRYFFRKLDPHLAGRALHDFEICFRVDRGRVFRQTGELRQ